MRTVTAILFVLFFSINISSQWVRTNGPEGISIRSISVIDNIIYAGTDTDGLYASDDEGNTWYPLNSGIETERVSDIIQSEGILYAGIFGKGVYRSTDRGQSWIAPLTGNNYAITSVIAKDSFLFAGAVSGGVLRSSDGGVNWEDAGFYYSYCKDLCISGNKLFATSGHHSMVTTDNGANWTRVDDLLGGSLFSLYSKGDLIIAGGRNEIFRSTDQGDNFTSIPVPFNFSLVNFYNFTSIGDTLFAATSYDGVYKSTDNGLNWFATTSGMGAKDVRDIAVTVSSVLIAGSHYAGLYRSENNGLSWNKSMSGFPAGSTIAKLITDETGIIAGTRDGIYRSSDNGDTWNKLSGDNDTINHSLVRGLCSENGVLYAGVMYQFNGFVYKSTDDGVTWQRCGGRLSNFVNAVAVSGSNIIAGTGDGIFYSTDKGDTWQPSNIDIYVNDMVAEAGYVYAALIINGIYRSADNGVTWHPVFVPPSIDIITLDALDNYVYSGAFDIDANYSSDFGSNWYPANGFGPGRNVYSVAFVPTEPGMVVVGTDIEPDYIYASYNYNNFFVPYSEGLGVNAVTEALTANDQFVFAGTTRNGVWRRLLPGAVPVELVSFTADVTGAGVNIEWQTSTEKNNKGFEIERSELSEGESQKWEKIGFVEGKGTTSEQQFYSFIDKNLEAGEYQYRLKQLDFNGAFEYSEISEVSIEIPDEYFLSQNFPNPFNPSTTISYQLPEDGMVSVKVYDVLGNEITTLVNEQKTAGRYKLIFDATGLANGVYIYKLQSNDFVSARKMMLVK